MLMLVHRVLRQIGYWWSIDRPASLWAKMYLRFKYDCYVSRRSFIFYPDKIKLGENSTIYEHAMLNFKSSRSHFSPSIDVGSNSQIMPYAKIIPQQGFVKIGKNCTVQYGCLLYGVGGLEIGDNTRIAAHTVVSPMNHVFKDPHVPIWTQGETALGIKIGNDVWIGSGVKILDGVVIGDGSVVGAGSVVTKSIPPFSIAVGVPARVISRRDGGMSEA
ncbi:MAG: acyltransferase [Nitrospira sp.]